MYYIFKIVIYSDSLDCVQVVVYSDLIEFVNYKIRTDFYSKFLATHTFTVTEKVDQQEFICFLKNYNLKKIIFKEY